MITDDDAVPPGTCLRCCHKKCPIWGFTLQLGSSSDDSPPSSSEAMGDPCAEKVATMIQLMASRLYSVMIRVQV